MVRIAVRVIGFLATAALVLISAADGAKHKHKVFGLGPGRTGTDSLKAALEELGFGPTYHMQEALFEVAGISTAGHLATWKRAGDGEQIDWDNFLRDWPSGCDFPLSAFPEELLTAFPAAKFVLTKRPAAEWYRSIANTVCQSHGTTLMDTVRMIPFFPFNRFAEQIPALDAMIQNKFAPGVAEVQSWDDLCKSEIFAVAAYNAWNVRVEALIPNSQLLVFEVGKHGYTELADFLGVEQPSKTYPKLNSAAEFQKLLVGMRCVAVAVYVVPCSALLFVTWAMLRSGRSKGSKTD